MFIVVKSGIEGTFPLACPLVQFPRFVHMANESMPWHNPREEEKYLDNETVHLFCLGSSLLIRYPNC